VTRDVRVGDRVAIPAGAQARGEVTMVERGGKLKDKARLGIRFTSVVLADGTRIPLETDTIYREGRQPGRREHGEDRRRRHRRRHPRRHLRRREGRSHWRGDRRGRAGRRPLSPAAGTRRRSPRARR
jgi:hypothetical protein